MATIVINHAEGSTGGETSPKRPRPAAPTVDPVAMPTVTVDGTIIPREVIVAELQYFPSDTPAEAWQAAAGALVVRELLLREALRMIGTAAQQADEDGRMETEEDALVRALIETQVVTPTADEETARRFFDRNPERFVTPPLFEADHILVAARREDTIEFARAREAIVALAAVLAAAPGRFEALAREASQCPSGKLGGSLGQIGLGDTTPEFEAALVELEQGEISAPVETRYGVHLIRLRRRIEGRGLPFEAVRERICRYLDESVRRRATAQYVALLVGRADIRGIRLDGAASPLVQ